MGPLSANSSVVKPSVSIEKLSGASNYPAWSFAVKLALISNQTWRVVSGTTPKPPAIITGAAAASPTTAAEAGTETEESVEARKVWTDLDEMAQATIGLLVDSTQHVHIRNASTSKEMWDALASVHQRKGRNARLYLLRKLWNSRYVEGTPMQSHINKVSDLVLELANIGRSIPDDELGAVLVNSLPPSWDYLVTSFDSIPEDSFTSSMVITRLLGEEDRRAEQRETTKGSSSRSGSGSALATNKQQGKRSDRRRDTCANCGKKGHWARDCRSERKPKSADARNPSPVHC
jgi:hypothetical protein